MSPRLLLQLPTIGSARLGGSELLSVQVACSGECIGIGKADDEEEEEEDIAAREEGQATADPGESLRAFISFEEEEDEHTEEEEIEVVGSWLRSEGGSASRAACLAGLFKPRPEGKGERT